VTASGLLAVVLALAAASVPAASPTSEERQRLVQGEVVYRVGAAPRDGASVPGARGAVAFVRVPAGPDAIWAILTEPARYPEIFPGLRTVEVLESSERAWLIKTDGKFGPFSFRYFTRYQLEPEARTMTWRLDSTRENDVFDDNWGWWQLVPEEGGTLVVYAIGSVASSWQPLAGFFERRGIMQALAALRDAAVRRGRT
jgi:ribosome-associated toxin RatA of RatAB toxin-antitoxin module